MWHVSSRSGVATLRTAIHLLLTYLLTYLPSVRYVCLITLACTDVDNAQLASYILLHPGRVATPRRPWSIAMMKRARLDAGAYWRHLVNTIDRFMRGGDASLCQITLTRVTQRYASAGTIYGPVSVSVCLSVCLSVTSRFSNEKDARNNLVCA